MPVAIHCDLQRRATRESLHRLWREPRLDPGRYSEMPQPVPVEPTHTGRIERRLEVSLH